MPPKRKSKFDEEVDKRLKTVEDAVGVGGQYNKFLEVENRIRRSLNHINSTTKGVSAIIQLAEDKLIQPQYRKFPMSLLQDLLTYNQGAPLGSFATNMVAEFLEMYKDGTVDAEIDIAGKKEFFDWDRRDVPLHMEFRHWVERNLGPNELFVDEFERLSYLTIGFRPSTVRGATVTDAGNAPGGSGDAANRNNEELMLRQAQQEWDAIDASSNITVNDVVFRQENVAGDGSCLFHAFAESYNQLPSINKITGKDARDGAYQMWKDATENSITRVAQLRNDWYRHMNQLSMFDPSKESMLDILEDPNKWGTLDHAFLLADYFNVEVYIYSTRWEDDKCSWELQAVRGKWQNDQVQRYQVQIGLYMLASHYVAFIPVDEGQDGRITCDNESMMHPISQALRMFWCASLPEALPRLPGAREVDLTIPWGGDGPTVGTQVTGQTPAPERDEAAAREREEAAAREGEEAAAREREEAAAREREEMTARATAD